MTETFPGLDLPIELKRLNAADCSIVSDWRPPHPDTWPRFSDAKRVGVDTEFRDATLTTLGVGVRRGPEHYMVGVSIAVEYGPKVYLPFRHGNGGEGRPGPDSDNLDQAQVFAYLKHEFKDFKGDLVGANLPCDLDWLWEAGIEMPQVHRFYDVQVADPLIYELHRNYTLNEIAKRRGLGGKSEELLRAAAQQYGVDPKADLWRVPARYVGPYAEDDGVLPLKILRKQEHDLAADGLDKAWDMESRLLPVLLRMSRKGVRVDTDRVDAMERWSHRVESRAWAEVKRATGIEVPNGNGMNTKLMDAVLRKAGLEDCIGQTEKSKREGTNKSSITKEGLSGVDHPVAQAIIDARKAATLRTTFITGLRNHMITRNGETRIHCTFNQIRKTEEASKDGGDDTTKGVKFGRLSSSHTNMQNQPAADRLTGDNLMGCMWRSVYLPERGEVWGSNDLKQQEPKWSFHFGAQLERKMRDGERVFPEVRGAIALCERLQADPLLDSYIPLVEATGKKRPVCKILWLKRSYGGGNGSIAEDLGMETQEFVFVPRKMKSVPVDSEEGQRAMQMDGHVCFLGAGPEASKIIQEFDDSMPFLKAAAKIAEDRAKERGYITLPDGRRCHFESLGADKNGKEQFEWCHKGFNRLIQGTSSWQLKEITLAVDEAGFGGNLMLPVHDELASSLESRERALAMAEIMKHVVPMEVPTVVDTETGPSWGESMFLEEVVDGVKTKTQYVWDVERRS